MKLFYRPQTKFAKVMFLQVSVCPQGGGIPACIAGGIPACLAGGIPACLAGLQGALQAHTRGGEVEGPGQGGFSRPTHGGSPGPPGGLQDQTRGDVSQHTLRQTPPWMGDPSSSDVVLLECILVKKKFLENTSPFCWATDTRVLDF